MKYKEAFREDFLNQINGLFGKQILDPEVDFGDSIPIDDIWRQLGYTLVYQNRYKTKCDQRKHRLYIDTREKSTRQRFDMAYELGNLVHQLVVQKYRNNKS